MHKVDIVPIPDRTPESIRTLAVIPSARSVRTHLRGRQTVCSAGCRIARSRQRREARQEERDANVRFLLHEALRLLNGESTQ
jgi:hypothetical protein